MAEAQDGYALVASFFTLSGAGFGEAPRHSFVERCRAASAAGFTGMGLHVDDLARTVASGLDVAGMRAVLADTGLRVVEIEFLGGWALDPDPAELEHTVGRIEAVADAFGGRHVSAGEFRSDRGLDLDAAATRLDVLARRLARRGLKVAVEGFPWSALAGTTAVPQLLRRLQAPNVGQLIDVWHFFNNGGTSDTVTGPIAAVQLNDGPRVHGDYLRHARAARRLPGEGELDVVGLVQAALRTGFTGPWCVEVNTPEFRALPVDEAARRAAAAASAALDAADAPRTEVRPPRRPDLAVHCSERRRVLGVVPLVGKPPGCVRRSRGRPRRWLLPGPRRKRRDALAELTPPVEPARMVDCHVHVFNPERFPYAPDTYYAPAGQELGTPARLAGVLDWHGVDHAVLVGPNSGYGEDNRLLLDTLAAGGGRYRGMAVVHNDVPRAELAVLKEAGVLGVTLNAALLGVDYYADAGPLLADLASLDMIADVQVIDDQLVALSPLLERSGVRVHFDHCGRPDPTAGIDAPGFRELLRWGAGGRAVVKLSGCIKVSRAPYPHTDLSPYIQALVDEFGPDHCVWASDWPFLRMPERVDYGPLLALLAYQVPAEADRRRILWETPCREFGFPLTPHIDEVSRPE